MSNIDYNTALRTEKWIIAISKRMFYLFDFECVTQDDEIGTAAAKHHKHYMQRIESLLKVLKTYIDKLRGYPTVSKGAEGQVVNMAKNNIGNLVSSYSSHYHGNILGKLFFAVEIVK
jgi:hypothetical protein